MDEQLNLTLPSRKVGSLRPSKLIPVLLFCLLVIGVTNLFVTLYGARQGETSSSDSGLSPEAAKELALKLERQGIGDRAAEAWKEYLSQATTGTTERAKVWYRIGKIYQEAGVYEQALEAYYRSEGHAQIPELESDLSRRIQECLEASGKFAALRYELADRVGIDKTEASAGEEVLAEIGTHKITKSGLDRRIEDQIERQLAQLKAFMAEDRIKSQKEALLKRLSNAQERRRFLSQIVLEEILYRKAREDKLGEDPDVRAILRDAERSILAQQVLEKEMAGQIKITPGDLQTYYEAHKPEYVEPEQVQISHILTKDRETADTLLKRLDQGEKFADLAKEYSLDDTTRDRAGEIDGWIRKGESIPGMGESEEVIKAVFDTGAGEFSKQTIQSDKGFHIIKVRGRKAEHQRTFDDVRSEVYRALRSQKESEVQQTLLSQLKERYNVVIHASRFQAKPSEDPGEKDNKRSGAKKTQ